jgi:hypothetical protein
MGLKPLTGPYGRNAESQYDKARARTAVCLLTPRHSQPVHIALFMVSRHVADNLRLGPEDLLRLRTRLILPERIKYSLSE